MRATLGEVRRLIREAAYAGMFKRGDSVLFGKWKNRKGKVAAIYLDDKGNPTIDIEPVSKGKKGTVTKSLYTIRMSPDDFDEQPDE